MTERAFQMIRVGPGDWLLPSNDQLVLWRIHSYDDGSHYGLMDVGYKSKTFWRLVWMPMPLVRGVPTVDLGSVQADGPWEIPWVERDWYMPTRQTAIDKALASDEDRTLFHVTPAC